MKSVPTPQGRHKDVTKVSFVIMLLLLLLLFLLPMLLQLRLLLLTILAKGVLDLFKGVTLGVRVKIKLTFQEGP